MADKNHLYTSKKFRIYELLFSKLQMQFLWKEDWDSDVGN